LGIPLNTKLSTAPGKAETELTPEQIAVLMFIIITTNLPPSRTHRWESPLPLSGDTPFPLVLVLVVVLVLDSLSLWSAEA